MAVKSLTEITLEHMFQAPIDPNTPEKKTILVVDDVLEFLNSIGAILGEEFDVVLAKNAEQAARILGKKSVNLIILDHGLPDMLGMEFLGRIRGVPALKSVPVVFLSANITQNMMTEAARHGAVGFIAKPVKKERLLETVYGILGKPEPVDTGDK